MGGAVQLMLGSPEVGPVTDRLVRDLFGLHRITWPEEEGVEFCQPHGERIRLLRSCGLEVEDLIEVQAPEDGVNDFVEEITLEWSRRWPSEEVWFARRPA
jgi:hypothetical protein